MRGESKAEVAGECEGKERNGESPLLEQEWYESDLQLAAELGKTLLERNKELETSLRQQQMIIDDNTLEIEHLSKQNSSLKEINESRLKVYEQLEISLQDLEKANKALLHEAKVDKSHIKSLNSYVESLEKKCEELQKSVDELRAASSRQHLQKRRERRRTLGLGMEFDAAELRRVMSVENGLSHRAGEQHSWDPEKEAEFLRLQQTTRELRTQKSREQRLKEELELETACLMQENEQLQEQLNSLQQREIIMKALQVELQEMEEEFNSHRCCSHSHQQQSSKADSGGHKSPIFLDSEHEVEDQPPSSDKCAVVKLRNGGQAYGSQETLVSAGKVILGGEGNASRPEEEHSSLESSLLSELDTQYRLLIEKYEAMVSARRRMTSPESHSDSEAEDFMDEREYRSMGHWTGTEESSSLSSGFSDDIGQVHKAVQTDSRLLGVPPSNGASPTRGLAGLRTHKNPFENHFNHTPEYKKLFQEIFAVLKKTISYEEAGAAAPPAVDTYPPLASREGTPSDDSTSTPPPGRSYADVARCRVRGRK